MPKIEYRFSVFTKVGYNTMFVRLEFAIDYRITEIREIECKDVSPIDVMIAWLNGSLPSE